jgi:hypothetical protein
MARWTIARAIPVPLVPSVVKYGSKMRGMISGGIPVPSSSTSMTTSLPTSGDLPQRVWFIPARRESAIVVGRAAGIYPVLLIAPHEEAT